MYQWEKFRSNLKVIAVCVSLQKDTVDIYLFAFHFDSMLPLYKSLMAQKNILHKTKQNRIITKQCHISWWKRHDYFRFGNKIKNKKDKLKVTGKTLH